MHYYFATRQELLRNAFAFSEQRWQEALDAELEHVETGAARVERMLLATIETGPPFSEQRALGNEVWSSLRTDEELRPVVERSYRAWLGADRRRDRGRKGRRLDPGRASTRPRRAGGSRRQETGSTRCSTWGSSIATKRPG